MRFGLVIVLMLATLMLRFEPRPSPSAYAIAPSMLVQHSAAVRAYMADGGLAGILNATQMALPASYAPMKSWSTIIDRGAVITWWVPQADMADGAAQVLAELERTSEGIVVGMKISGQFRRNLGSPLSLTGVIPDGAIIIHTQVRPIT